MARTAMPTFRHSRPTTAVAALNSMRLTPADPAFGAAETDPAGGRRHWAATAPPQPAGIGT
eukprot:11160315-Lingulodinium_polyedra.AAC.1